MLLIIFWQYFHHPCLTWSGAAVGFSYLSYCIFPFYNILTPIFISSISLDFHKSYNCSTTSCKLELSRKMSNVSAKLVAEGSVCPDCVGLDDGTEGKQKEVNGNTKTRKRYLQHFNYFTQLPSRSDYFQQKDINKQFYLDLMPFTKVLENVTKKRRVHFIKQGSDITLQ